MEMGYNKQICRLCLEIVPAGDAETIGEKKKQILDVLLINIDLHIIDNAVACSRCMDELQSGFEFKSGCFHVDNCISTFADDNVPADMKKIFQGEMRDTAMANVNVEDRQICRLCMSLIEDKALDCNTALKDVIENCLPEVDMHRVHTPVVCELCFSRMKKLYEFMNTCQEVERRINNCHLQAGVDHAIPGSVNLNDLLKFKDYTIGGNIKDESSNFDCNLLTNPKKEDTANIKCEETHIKDELDSVEEMSDSVPSGSSKNSAKSDSFERKWHIEQSTTKGRMHFSSDDHMARHGVLTKAYGCQECTFKSDRKDILVQHMLRHKDKTELEMHKCENCEFETRYQSSMIDHMVKHHDPKAERKLKCDKCKFETRYKGSMFHHMVKHRDPKAVDKFKCENCEFETMYKGSMIRHKLKHRDPSAGKKFKCDKCPYETDFKSDLRKHLKKHKDKSEVEMHKCKNCDFETRYKSSMTQHMATHRDPKAERKFKCDKCPYRTDLKSYLRLHNVIHKDKSEMEMHKCDICEYETKRKDSMIRHMVKHRDPGAGKKFKCDKCPYETDFKSDFRKHLTHKDKSEVEMHKCENCDFETRYKSNMTQHMAKHRDPKAERRFQCDRCPYRADLKSYLCIHNMIHKDKSEVAIKID